VASNHPHPVFRRTIVADKRLNRLLAHVYGTDGTEIDCEEFQVLLPAYVESELNFAPQTLPAEAEKAIHAHLDHCPDCRDEYEGLREVLLLDSDGALPTIEEALMQFGAVDVTPEQPVGVVHCSE
jgi:hypothetical protein